MITTVDFKSDIDLNIPSTSEQRKKKVLSNNKAVAKKKLKESNVSDGSTFDFTVNTEESIHGIVIDKYTQKFSITV